MKRALENRSLDRGLTIIACPITRQGMTVGALALLWPRGYLSTTRFAELHARQLQETVAGISAGL